MTNSAAGCLSVAAWGPELPACVFSSRALRWRAAQGATQRSCSAAAARKGSRSSYCEPCLRCGRLGSHPQPQTLDRRAPARSLPPACAAKLLPPPPRPPRAAASSPRSCLFPSLPPRAQQSQVHREAAQPLVGQVREGGEAGEGEDPEMHGEGQPRGRADPRAERDPQQVERAELPPPLLARRRRLLATRVRAEDAAGHQVHGYARDHG